MLNHHDLLTELLDRPRNVMIRFTDITLNSYMVTWEGICDDILDKSPVTGYYISWYNLGRDILGSLLVSSLCEEDSPNEHYVANFTSELPVDFLSISGESICGIGEATNIINNSMLF